jgi:tetratricopeptide (TPR) repeat protein
VDWQLRDIIRRGRGDVGVRLFWARWRDHLVRRGTAEQVVAYVATLARGIRPNESSTPQLFDDLDPVLARFETSGGGGVTQRLVLAHTLLALDRASDAQRVLEPVVSGDDPEPEALDLSSETAERLGRFADAVRFTERAVEVSADLEIPLELVRKRYRKLLGLHVKRHKANAAERTLALAAVVATARDWRREDPDNAEVDLTVAAALDRLGMAAEANRQLFSIVDRHPGEGDAFAKVAAAMEDRGQFDEAVLLYGRAIDVEPTNPTWLLSKSHVLRARGQAGDPATARALLEQIERGKWQDRFAPQVNEARRLLAEAR